MATMLALRAKNWPTRRCAPSTRQFLDALRLELQPFFKGGSLSIEFTNQGALASKIKTLADSARANQLNPDELADATYTVSNIGSFKNLMGTPIIMQPQVAILAPGAIVKKPAVIETPQGDASVIRHKMFLSHSYDHRVIDGALGGMFAQRVADYLEAFDVSRQF